MPFIHLYATSILYTQHVSADSNELLLVWGLCGLTNFNDYHQASVKLLRTTLNYSELLRTTPK